MDYFPLLPVPKEKALGIAKKFAYVGSRMLTFKPGLEAQLAQAEIRLEPEIFAVLALMSGLFQGVMLFILLIALLFVLNQTSLIPLATVLSFVMIFFMTIQVLSYPGFILTQKVKKIEQSLMFALRHLLIEVKGGVPLFNALVGVSSSDYGELSSELERVVQETNAGQQITTSLENMALRNPSPYLRRTIWQIVNGLRTGTDMGETLRYITEQFTEEQRVLLEKFGKELAPYAMMYMVVTVIFPTLMITMFLILSSLSRFTLNAATLAAIIIGSAMTQFFVIQLIKAKRPNLRW